MGRVEARGPGLKLAALAFGLSLLTLSALLSWLQPQPGQYAPAPHFGDWRWWLTPIENNSFARPAATDNGLNGICVIPGTKGRSLVAVGFGGTILRTNDGGETWKTQRAGTTADLAGVIFADSKSGWAVGDKGTILHSSDSGVTWTNQRNPTTVYLKSVTFANASVGWAVGDKGTILRTSDGGGKWENQSQKEAELYALTSVTFVNAQAGWAVGGGGTILHTSDGGVTWKFQVRGASLSLHNRLTGGPTLSGRNSEFQSVTFADTKAGWVTAENGFILNTSDGGATWSAQTGAGPRSLFGIVSSGGRSAWAVGRKGTILHTSDGGDHWTPQAAGAYYLLSGVAAADVNSAWAVGLNGLILHTGNGGANWTIQASGTRANLSGMAFRDANSLWATAEDGMIVHTDLPVTNWKGQSTGRTSYLSGITFPNANSGWAVGFGGRILHTSDGGVNWTDQSSGSTKLLNGVAFADANAGWVAGDDGTILHTSDGRTWQAQGSGTTVPMLCVAAVSADSAWTAGFAGTILHTSDGGVTWKKQSSPGADAVTSLSFLNANTGWAAGDNGTILHTSDGGAKWEAQVNGAGLMHFSGIRFVDANRGWAVGYEGLILQTSDGGMHWRPQASGTSDSLNALVFADANSGWSAGAGGAVLHTSSGGINWRQEDAFRYRRWPAPWLFLAAASVIPLLVWAASPTVVIDRSRIEELVSSDSPVTNVKEDRLGQRALVERLSRFLRNPNTSPPLVISLQARWGMGKSSVMRMLESSLKENRAAVTVWFNAWHHQKEDQLLAYLLETIQKEAVPPWLTPVGVSFRFDLLRVRLFSGIDRLAVMLVALTFLTFRVVQPDLAIFDYQGWKKWAVRTGYLAAGWVIVQMLVAFKSNPEKLTDKSGGFLVHALKELITLPSLVGKSDVRQEFANNFKDVAQALSPQRLVIFLDDLDRCKPEQVVQILEAINFLSSVAPCVIIVGADYEKVETLVAMQFEQIALREEENAGSLDAAARIVTLRVNYARNYLKKIVNLRLNLRLPTPDDYRKLLDEQPARRRQIGRYFQRAGVFAILAMPVLLTVGISRLVQKPAAVAAPVREEPAAAVAVAGKPVPAAAAGPIDTPLPTQTAPVSTVNHAGDDGGFIRNWLIFGVPGFIALGAMVYWYSRPRRLEEVQDAESFARALKSRGEDIYKRCESPREVRRFLNYLRLIATASGSDEEDDIEGLRKKYPASVDSDLVDLATRGETSDAGPDDAAIRKYFEAQCDLFGLDPQTFAPRESRTRLRRDA